MPATLALMASAYPRNERRRRSGYGQGWPAAPECSGWSVPVRCCISRIGGRSSGPLPAPPCWWRWRAGRAASRNADAPPVDWVGAVLIAAAAAVTVTGLLHAPQHGWVSPPTLGCLAAGLACGSAFVVVERKRRWPLVDVGLFADQGSAAGVATILVLFAATFGFFTGHAVCAARHGLLGTDDRHRIHPVRAPRRGAFPASLLLTPRLGLRRVLAAGLLLIAAGFRRRLRCSGARPISTRQRASLSSVAVSGCALHRRFGDHGRRRRGAAGHRIGDQRCGARARGGAGHCDGRIGPR